MILKFNFIQKSFVLITVIFLTAFKPYTDESQELADRLNEMLIAKGECAKRCSRNGMLYRSGTSESATISIYKGIDNHEFSTETLNEVIELCHQFYIEKNEELIVKLNVFSMKQSENNSPFFKEEPYISLTFKRIK